MFDDKIKFINKPADGQDDHLLDAARYWVMGELMGRIKQPRDNSGDIRTLKILIYENDRRSFKN